MCTSKPFKVTAAWVLAIILAFGASIRAQEVEVKLGGNTASQEFTVKDNTGNILFSVMGDGRTAIGRTPFGGVELSIGSPSGRIPLGIIADVPNGPALSVRNTSLSGSTQCVIGEILSPDGAAVTGAHLGGSGTGVGVWGSTNSTGSGVGVLGFASSTSARAVTGMNSAANTSGSIGGNTYGVSGVGGTYGVEGWQYKTSGINYGVHGKVESPDGMGVYGGNNATSGMAIGILGETKSSQGVGLKGKNPSGCYGEIGMEKWGVNGISPVEIGVRGVHTGTSGWGEGVRGESFSQDGVGVNGVHTGTSGSGMGVRGETMSPDGAGVRGVNTANGTYGFLGSSLAGVQGVGVSQKYAGHFTGEVYATGVIETENKLHSRGIIQVDGASYLNDACHLQGPVWVNHTQVTPFPSPNYNFNVEGTAGKNGGGSWSTLSDIRLKDVDGPYERGLSEIIRLRPIRFHYKKDNPCAVPSDQQEYGYSAQEVQKIFPEAVRETANGYLDFNLHPIHIATISAVKELHELIQNQNTLIAAQNERIQKLEREIAQRNSAPEDSKFSEASKPSRAK